jgi:hypothetical protein
MNESVKHLCWELQELVDLENHLLLMNWVRRFDFPEKNNRINICRSF